MRNIKDSIFGPDSVGKLHVPVQNAKHTKSKSTAVKVKYEFLLFCPILCVTLCEFICSVNSYII